MGTRHKVITASTSTMRTPGVSVSGVSTVLLLLHTAHGSLMSRIGLRLGAAHHAHHHSALEHKPRQPWAVRNMKAEMLANERKPGQPPKPRQVGSLDEEERPTACVGICYYNKLMALEAKEDLANHNMVYKTDSKDKEEPCDNQINCNNIDEDITLHDDINPESSDNNVIVIDDEQAQNDVKIRHSSSSEASDAIYIDSVGGEDSDSNNIDISRV